MFNDTSFAAIEIQSNSPKQTSYTYVMYKDSSGLIRCGQSDKYEAQETVASDARNSTPMAAFVVPSSQTQTGSEQVSILVHMKHSCLAMTLSEAATSSPPAGML